MLYLENLLDPPRSVAYTCMFLICLVILCVAYGDRPLVRTVAVNDELCVEGSGRGLNVSFHSLPGGLKLGQVK
jgi:hypothetical protein